MTRNQYTPRPTGEQLPVVIEQHSSDTHANTIIMVGEGDEVVIRGINRNLVKADPENPGAGIPLDSFGVIMPVIFTEAYAPDDAAINDGFNFENFSADQQNGVVKVAERLRLSLPSSASGSLSWQKEIVTAATEDRPDDAIKLARNLSRTVMLHSFDTNLAEIPEGHGLTNDAVLLGRQPNEVSIVVDGNDLSTAQVQVATGVDLEPHETEIGRITFGSLEKKFDGSTDLEDIIWSVKGPKADYATRSAGFIIEASGKIKDLRRTREDHKLVTTSELYDQNSGNVINFRRQA